MVRIKIIDVKEVNEELVEELLEDTDHENQEVNTQPNTPTTKPKGEGQSGKINGDLSVIRSEDGTAGVETNHDVKHENQDQSKE